MRGVKFVLQKEVVSVNDTIDETHLLRVRHQPNFHLLRHFVGVASWSYAPVFVITQCKSTQVKSSQVKSSQTCTPILAGPFRAQAQNVCNCSTNMLHKGEARQSMYCKIE